ncbi:MAG: EndoU domain-containing protein [Bacteroidia bacterium]
MSFNLPKYKSLKELRQNDPTWKQFLTKDPRSANKICEDQFLICGDDIILTPLDEEFNKVAHKLLQHTLMGELTDDINGIHMISKFNPSIKNAFEVRNEDKNGVWIATIEYYSGKRNKTFTKQESTMFPKKWCASTYMFEICFAYHNKKRKSPESEYHISHTSSGVPVEFVIKNGNLKTVYPIYQE